MFATRILHIVLYCILFGLSTLSGPERSFVYRCVLPQLLKLQRNKRHVEVFAHTRCVTVEQLNEGDAGTSIAATSPNWHGRQLQFGDVEMCS